MRLPPTTSLVIVAACLAAAGACTPDFEEAWEVRDLRLLAMRAEPPLLVAAMLLSIGAALALHTAHRKTLTADEPKHLVTGLHQLATGRCCLGVDNGPTLALNALPVLPGEHPGAEHVVPTRNSWKAGRAFLLAEPDLQRTVWRMRLPSVALWAAFAQAYVLRAGEAPLFAILALALTISLVAYVVTEARAGGDRAGRMRS